MVPVSVDNKVTQMRNGVEHCCSTSGHYGHRLHRHQDEKFSMVSHPGYLHQNDVDECSGFSQCESILHKHYVYLLLQICHISQTQANQMLTYPCVSVKIQD